MGVLILVFFPGMFLLTGWEELEHDVFIEDLPPILCMKNRGSFRRKPMEMFIMLQHKSLDKLADAAKVVRGNNTEESEMIFGTLSVLKMSSFLILC